MMGFNSEAGLKKKLPGPFDVEYIDKRSGQKEMMAPSERHYEFHVEGLTPEIKKLIDATGTHDVHKITAECFTTLAEYYEFYKAQLSANMKP